MLPWRGGVQLVIIGEPDKAMQKMSASCGFFAFFFQSMNGEAETSRNRLAVSRQPYQRRMIAVVIDLHI